MDLYTKLSSCVEELSSTFASRMTQYEEDLKNASGEAAHKTIASLSKDFTEFKTLVWKTLGSLKSQMELLVLGLDRHEMASRGKILLLHGLSEDRNTDPTAGFLAVVSEHLNMVQVASKDLTACHRLGSNTSRPRPLLVRFESRIVRNEVWRNKTKLKGSGLTLSEFLTKPRHDTFMNARKHYGVHKCWTSEGKIVVRVSDKLRRKIESPLELRELLVQYPVGEPAAVSSKPVTEKRTRKPAKS
ncbi:hypothetical protein PYW08_001664 [Mythimna loreyi]|uniref:Uncharacterized protein n=2 Tax=Mythimna loreyi TaxID=667449 RepID=A0ACC2R0P5_9NEOP|nr:hypothetical protein PYW08_001135 [Mythimna loreyi]KAJ8733366.1 hypothetical protein PYW08_001664 [Mythimna loreyi]